MCVVDARHVKEARRGAVGRHPRDGIESAEKRRAQGGVWVRDGLACVDQVEAADLYLAALSPGQRAAKEGGNTPCAVMVRVQVVQGNEEGRDCPDGGHHSGHDRSNW